MADFPSINGNLEYLQDFLRVSLGTYIAQNVLPEVTFDFCYRIALCTPHKLASPTPSIGGDFGTY